jgi:hypothetical protein
MFKRFLTSVALVAVGAGAAVAVWGSWIAPHEAAGTVSTATSAQEELYICQPSGTTTAPICPVDTNGADEAIFVTDENLIPGAVAWQKVRLTNVGSLPWDVLSVSKNWTKVTDPSGACNTLPEAINTPGGAADATAPGITVLGKVNGGANTDPVDHVGYDALNDDHGTVNGSASFLQLGSNNGVVIHVAPGDYEDMLLGIRLPITAPDACLGAVWQLTTTWTVQNHVQ